MINVVEFNRENNPNKIYYSCPPLEIGQYEREWLNNIKKEILANSECEHNILVNCTWFNVDGQMDEYALKKLARQFKIKYKKNIKIWFAASIDGLYFIQRIYDELKKQNFVVTYVGYGDDHWHSWYPTWIFNNNKSIKNEDVSLKRPPKYLYLSYNRKPRNHRIKLIDSLEQNALIDRGWITFEKGYYSFVDELSGNTETNHPTDDIRFSRPEDLTSLGDSTIWQNSYCVIVSETDSSDPWQLSEKTWKPIFGLRPFLINGHSNLYNLLEKLGFYTPRDFFKNKNLNPGILDTVEQIKLLYQMDNESLFNLYQTQYEMLMYNKQRMREMAETDSEKILNWSQAKNKPN